MWFKDSILYTTIKIEGLSEIKKNADLFKKCFSYLIPHTSKDFSTFAKNLGEHVRF